MSAKQLRAEILTAFDTIRGLYYLCHATGADNREHLALLTQADQELCEASLSQLLDAVRNDITVRKQETGCLLTDDDIRRIFHDMTTPDGDGWLYVPKPFIDRHWQAMLNGAAVPGRRYSMRSNYLDEFSAGVIEVFEAGVAKAPSPNTGIVFVSMGGAVSRVAPEATAYVHRGAAYTTTAIGGWLAPQEDDANIARLRGLWKDLPPHLPNGVDVNELQDEGPDRIRAADGQLGPAATDADILGMDAGAVHPLTGPVYVKGARPGDLLEVEFVDIRAEQHAFSAIIPGLGFLRDLYTTPFPVHWRISDGWATSPQLPGLHIPGAPFMGVSAVAPSQAQRGAWATREQDLANQGGFALPPDPAGAVPAQGPAATHGLRTIPPRENGGNFDVKQLTTGSTLWLPVAVEGALFSVGDGHFAQGDGEVCVTAVEMGATVAVRLRVLKGAAARARRGPRFAHGDYFAPPQWAAPQRFTATMGMPIRDDGSNDGENLTLACRNALLNMMDLLQERGWSREQAYVICSVAVDLRISNVVDVPNYVVSAFLPEAIFQG